ncbi:MAG: hypothetical protein WBN88_20025 [Anderseniella sp.]
MKKSFLNIPAIVMLVLGSVSAKAADLEEYSPEEIEKRHHVEVFLGNTHTEEGNDAFSFGAQYEYRLSSLIGIGILGEYAFENIDAWVVGAPLTIHPGAGWQLVAMPGVEIEDSETKFLFRAGVGYEFELEQFSIKPEVNADFVGGDVNLVFGVSLGFGF